MRPIIFLSTLFVGCQTTLYQAPKTGDGAFIRISQEASGSDHSHRFEVSINGARLARPTGVRVKPGRQTVAFEGEYFEVIAPTPHEEIHHHGIDHHLWCGDDAVSGAAAIAGLGALAIVGIANAVNESKHAGGEKVIDRCSAKIKLELEPEDDVEVVFHHDADGTCTIECWEHTASGPQSCPRG